MENGGKTEGKEHPRCDRYYISQKSQNCVDSNISSVTLLPHGHDTSVLTMPATALAEKNSLRRPRGTNHTNLRPHLFRIGVAFSLLPVTSTYLTCMLPNVHSSRL